MTQPDPDPTNRELVRVLVDTGLTDSEAWQVREALSAAGYQFVPKVELEGKDAAIAAAQRWFEAYSAVSSFTEKEHRERNRGLRLALQALDKENG